MKTFLFAYGTLKHPYQPPKSSSGWIPAETRAQGFVFPEHDYPIAVDPGCAATLYGELVCMDDDEFPEIDKREDQRLNEREKVDVIIRSPTDRRIVKAWMYVWRRPVPAHAKPIECWDDMTNEWMKE